MNFIKSYIESYLPSDFSLHGDKIDFLIIITHYLMFFLFIGWGIYFIYTLIRFRSSNHPKANYKGVTSHYSTYVEIGIIIFEVFLIVGLALPYWTEIKISVPEEKNIELSNTILKHRSDIVSEWAPNDDLHKYFTTEDVNKNLQIVHIIAQTFSYNVHYPGPDGKFGPRYKDKIQDDESEFIGLDWKHENSKDDIVLQDELILEVGKPVLIHLTSRDVIHSFYLPEFRVKQDAIPGQSVPIFFTPTITTAEFLEGYDQSSDEKFSIWEWIAEPKNNDKTKCLDFNHNGECYSAKKANSQGLRAEDIPNKFGRDTFQLACAQLCGSGHSEMMKGDLFVLDSKEYQQWYFGRIWEQKNYVEPEDGGGWDDDWF